MSTPQEKSPLYVDFKETGGVIHSRPSRLLPELVFTGKTKSELEIQLEQHAKMVQEMLGESANKGLYIRKTRGTARSAFLNLSVPFPGLTELKDNFYTGWFNTFEAGGIYAAFRKVKGIPSSHYDQVTGRDPYFLLGKAEAAEWNQRLRKKNPLTVSEMDQLFLFPGIKSHASFENLARLNLKELTDRVDSTADSFWSTFKTFGRDDTSDAKREFIRENLLDLEILDRVHRRSHAMAQGEIRESMERNEITVFPLGQEGGVVRYLSDIRENNQIGTRNATTRILPLPHNLMGNFQRYGRLGQRPMTKIEFEALYRRLVDPNTQLFGMSS